MTDIASKPPQGGEPELRLRVSSDWKEVERVYEEVGRFLGTWSLSDETVDRCTMVVCELVENGIKYGHFGRIGDTVSVYLVIRNGTISVQVTNPIGPASRNHLPLLDRTIQWVRGFQAPFEAFVARMKAISREPIEEDKSRLGLLRITYEGRAMLDFYVEEDEMLSVSAVTSID